jgi:hypothetical protein
MFRGQGHDWYYWADSYGNSDIPEFEQYGGALVIGGPAAGPLGRVSYGQKARAGADVYGRRIVSCESFTLLDGDGDTNNPSLKLMNQSLNNVLGAGANKIMMHGYTYSPQDQSWSENFRASAKFNHWHPFFRSLKAFPITVQIICTFYSRENRLWTFFRSAPTPQSDIIIAKSRKTHAAKPGFYKTPFP